MPSLCHPRDSHEGAVPEAEDEEGVREPSLPAAQDEIGDKEEEPGGRMAAGKRLPRVGISLLPDVKIRHGASEAIHLPWTRAAPVVLEEGVDYQTRSDEENEEAVEGEPAEPDHVWCHATGEQKRKAKHGSGICGDNPVLVEESPGKFTAVDPPCAGRVKTFSHGGVEAEQREGRDEPGEEGNDTKFHTAP